MFLFCKRSLLYGTFGTSHHHERWTRWRQGLLQVCANVKWNLGALVFAGVKWTLELSCHIVTAATVRRGWGGALNRTAMNLEATDACFSLSLCPTTTLQFTMRCTVNKASYGPTA